MHASRPRHAAALIAVATAAALYGPAASAQNATPIILSFSTVGDSRRIW